MSSAVKLMLVGRTMFFSTTSSSVRKSKTRSDDITGCQVQKNWPWTPLEAKVAAAATRVFDGHTRSQTRLGRGVVDAPCGSSCPVSHALHHHYRHTLSR